MIDPKLLVVKPVDELEEVNSLQPGSLLFYDGAANLKRIDTDLFYQLLNNIARPIAPSDTGPFTANRWYKPTTSSPDPGTDYPNAGNLKARNGYDTLFWYDGTIWTKTEYEIPQSIEDYDSTKSYSEFKKFYYKNQIYSVKVGQILNVGEDPEAFIGIKLDLISTKADENGNLFSFEAGLYNSTGLRNTGFGRFALRYNENGNDNTAIGINALSNRLDAGNRNTAIGSGSLYDNEGDNNTAIGYDSLSQVKGNDNVGIGVGANNGVINGIKNTAIGTGSGVNGDYSNTISIGAGAVATKSGQAVIGNDNVIELKVYGNIVSPQDLIYWSDYANYNYFLGGSGRSNFSNFTANVYGNTALGYKALEDINDSMMNTAIGHQALQKLTGGADHTAVGAGALQNQIDGVGCTAMGRLAMANSTHGTNNTGIGDTALEFNVDGNSNTAVGYSAGIKAGGSFNTLMGTFAGGHHEGRFGPLCTWSNTNVFGAGALQYNETFDNNNIFGTYAAHTLQGEDNSAFGYESMRNAINAKRNSCFGNGSGYWLESGNDNVFIGYNSGRDGQVRAITGSTVIGANAYSIRDNEIVIGKTTDTHVRIAGVEFTKEQIEAIPKNVDTDILFDTISSETGVLQITADANASNTSVGSIHGISTPIGSLSNPSGAVKIAFAQNTATPVTEIEVRLFQGKTVGGTHIATKRQTIPAASTVQTSATITFDTPIDYTGKMWCQILMNAPFAYKKVQPATRRTSAGGYGQTFITTVNNLDGTTFPTTQNYVDLFLEFNTLQTVIATTGIGEDVIISSITEKVTSDITGDYTGVNSYLSNDGTIATSTNWRTSELISVIAGKTYTYQGSTAQSTAAVCMVGYNSNNVATVLVGNSDHFTTPIDVVIPVGIVKVRICGYVSTPPTLKISEQKIFPSLIPSEISGKIAINKVWNCVGHSIWAQDGIVYSGTSTIAEGMQTLIRRIYKFNGYNKYCYSGRSLGATAPSGDTNSITNYFSTWIDNRDGIWSLDSITNDFKRDIPIGTIADYNNATGVMTFYGALRAFNDKVQSLTPGATVFSFNALRRNNGGYTSTSVNAAGHTLLDYEKAIMTISALNGWRFIDQFRQSEITDETLSITTLDGLHPNNFGYTLAVKPFIRTIGIYASEKV